MNQCPNQGAVGTLALLQDPHGAYFCGLQGNQGLALADCDASIIAA